MLPERQSLYELSKHDIGLYLTDVERIMTHGINGRHGIVLRDKFLSYQVLSPHTRVPNIQALYMNGKIDHWEPSLDEVLRDGMEASLFIKPVTSAGGGGAEKIRLKQGSVLGKDFTQPFEEYITAKLERYPDLFVMSALQQNAFMSDLFPESVNTVRVLTVRDPRTRRPWLARAVVRVGNLKSAPVDNFSRGGIAFGLDTETGKILCGVTKDAASPSTVRMERHPDTGRQIAGLTVPGFDMVKERCVTLHTRMPYINYVGWDICIGPDDLYVVEANNTTDVDLLQAHGPLLSDPRLRAFYAASDIL